MKRYSGPLLTRQLAGRLLAQRDSGALAWTASMDLGRSQDLVHLAADAWQWREQSYPYPVDLKDRTIHFWDGKDFVPVSRYSGALIKLVPTDWGVPTFEIDGIKMLPTARESPLDDARRKVALVQPAGKVVLDTCGGLGYFATCALEAGATQVCSFERNAEVLWLRSINPWSPDAHAHADRFSLQHADVLQAIDTVPDASFGAALHDPPRFGIAGELYSAAFYAQLARVLKRGARLFHYTGTPNKLSSGRDLPREVARRLQTAGFKAEPALDGVLAIRR
jgi:predicted methyltransferase